jgi:hypothetical protein
MIISTIDLWSMGTPARKVLHTIKIANDATGSATAGNDQYEIWSGSQRVRSGEIKGFPRQRKNGAQLLQLVLNDAYPPKVDRNEEDRPGEDN